MSEYYIANSEIGRNISAYTLLPPLKTKVSDVVQPVLVVNPTTLNVVFTPTIRRPTSLLSGATASNSTITLGTVPAGKKWTVLSYTLSGYTAGATANNYTLKLGTATAELLRVAGTATTAGFLSVSKNFPYEQAVQLVAGDTITYISSGIQSEVLATAQIYEESA